MEIKAPNAYSPVDKRFKVFLAGSIDMGQAEDWQRFVSNFLAPLDIIVLNPRRDDWDSSWEQSINNAQFREQVEWELFGMENADLIAMHFAENSLAPVTLLELGLAAIQPEKSVVYCHDQFWRKGNVDIVCTRYGIKQVHSILGLVQEIVDRMERHG